MAVMLQKFVASLLLLLLSIMGVVPQAASTSPIANSGCQSQCGNVSIWYPFGIGSADCFYNHWFEILCRQDRPYLSLNQDGVEEYEVLAMKSSMYDPRAITIRSNTSNIRFCKDTSDLVVMGADLTGSPFVYDDYNKLMLIGCGTATAKLSDGNDSIVGGCTSSCNGARGIIDGCHGINCCQDQSMFFYAFTPTELKLSFSKLFTGNNSCGSAFIVDDGWYPKNASVFSDPSADLVDVEVPLVLTFRIPTWMPGPGFENNKYCEPRYYQFWDCFCPCGFSGNPYILDGCQDSDGYHCSESYLKKNLTSIVVGGICLVISVVAAIIYMLYMIIRRRIERNHKDKRFKRNGGLLLQKYLSSNENIMEKVRLFTGKDLNKATDNFNENRVLGRGGQGTVYKGMLHDGKIVAIKKSKLLVNENQVEEFINEIIILSQIDHRNVVKLFGCCLEMDVPLLVYEFIPNGTLYNLIHSENTHYPLSWEVRLRIALEVAEALAYLHSATSIPIYHRDIKSSNILLDEKFKAKVADFGTSRNIGIDQTHLTTLVKGTFGYLDPEYFQSSQFTEKSDVYSFGVVLVELLTGLKPICFSEEEQSHLNLAGLFLLALEENRVNGILDPQVKETSNEEEREAIIRLSQQCLNMNGRHRPSMKEIVMELQNIKKSQIPSTVPVNSYENGDLVEIELERLGVVTSSHLTASSSDASPLISSSF
ncbi:transmembrane signal receptor [Lithospermum erythrorhizon]|uniref:Transmembrane signal receptor n=1 Tax=Lithospermum erythrorhizon TaxID=34254 RepID=A0AAV3QJM5_LITER